ncbi:MAG: 3-deoxy-D-manno-octulosonic acid transferase [bacterium]|nr:3-deoxy-D-manno-octulosonic acid transferase [bacterium]
MWLLYQLLYVLLAIVAGPWLLLRRGRHYLATLSPRLGHVPIAPETTLWVHAVSVGEVSVAASLAPILPESRPLVLTTVTPSGQERARSRFPGAFVTYLPFEIGLAVRRFFDRLQPAGLILCEGDLWPLVLREVRRRGIPAVVVNARISDRSFRRMRFLNRFLAPVLEPITAFAVQTELDGRRLLELGVEADRITVTGNLKFETGRPAEIPELEKAIVRLARGRPILVAGSTMRGEEEQVVEAFERLGDGDRALLVLAPRHPERWPRVVARLAKTGLRLRQRSQLDLATLDTEKETSPRVDVLVLDSLGELAAVYGLSAGAFIGGTLVPTGGHNPIEAACHGVPIAAGPSMHNFKEIEARFDDDRAWNRVRNAGDLAAVWDGWLRDPEAAAALGRRAAIVFESNQGALTKTRSFLERHLGQVAST